MHSGKGKEIFSGRIDQMLIKAEKDLKSVNVSVTSKIRKMEAGKLSIEESIAFVVGQVYILRALKKGLEIK